MHSVVTNMRTTRMTLASALFWAEFTYSRNNINIFLAMPKSIIARNSKLLSKKLKLSNKLNTISSFLSTAYVVLTPSVLERLYTQSRARLLPSAQRQATKVQASIRVRYFDSLLQFNAFSHAQHVVHGLSVASASLDRKSRQQLQEMSSDNFKP